MNAAMLKELGPLAGGLFGLIDSLVVTDAEKADAKLKVLELASTERIAQMGVNAKEAENKSLFVAGWRPAVGWICAIAIGWQFILMPVFAAVISFIAMYNGVQVDLSGLLTFNTAELMPLLIGMLGLTVSRSYEKVAGVASNNMKG